jgi:hypothetical protein
VTIACLLGLFTLSLAYSRLYPQNATSSTNVRSLKAVQKPNRVSWTAAPDVFDVFTNWARSQCARNWHSVRSVQSPKGPLCRHSSIVRRRSLSSKADPHQSQLQIWLQNRLHGREGVEAGRTLAVAIEELEKLAKERGDSDEIETIRTWLISAADTGP